MLTIFSLIFKPHRSSKLFRSFKFLYIVNKVDILFVKIIDSDVWVVLLFDQKCARFKIFCFELFSFFFVSNQRFEEGERKRAVETVSIGSYLYDRCVTFAKNLI